MTIEDKIDKYLNERKEKSIDLSKEEQDIIKRLEIDGVTPELGRDGNMPRITGSDGGRDGTMNWEIDINFDDSIRAKILYINLSKEISRRSDSGFVYSVDTIIAPDTPGPFNKIFPVDNENNSINILKSVLSYIKKQYDRMK